MYYYSFNDCFEKSYNDIVLSHCLSSTLKHYQQVSDEFPKEIRGILSDRSPQYFKVNDSSTLLDIILKLNKEEKNYALRLFTKYPLEDFYPELDIDNIFSDEYKIEVDSKHYDAICAKINHINDGFLFSLGLHTDLQKDRLCIIKNSKKYEYIVNLYGNKKNTGYNINIIREKINSTKKGFEKFITIFQEPIYYQSFIDDFNSMTEETQNAIIKKFEFAKNRNLATYFAPDDNLIKDVTPNNESKIKLFELRIFEPVCVRLYFYEESNEKVYLATVRKKPAKKVQTNDINTSISLVKSLKKIHN